MDDSAITKAWLLVAGFHVSRAPDRRKSEECTVFVHTLPFHLAVQVMYWEYPRSDCPDGIIVSMATYGGGPLRIPSEQMRTRQQFCRLIECLCGINLLDQGDKA